MTVEEFSIGRESRIISQDNPGATGTSELGGPWHAVPRNSAEGRSAVSLCNRTVHVWGRRVFDPAAAGSDGACPTCVQRSSAG